MLEVHSAAAGGGGARSACIAITGIAGTCRALPSHATDLVVAYIKPYLHIWLEEK